ncbi:NUDIX hydrolase [candidate division KSB1 bacterium]|nr:NUDIX hydrolase [candidate division KSB1 bacterium]
MKVKIHDQQRIFEGFINLDKATLQFEKFNGRMSRIVKRLNVYRGDAVAILLFDSKQRSFYFVRQFRYPIYTAEPENAWTLEVVAGSVEGTDQPIPTALREVEEEAGFRIDADRLKPIGRCYPSPGGTSERIFLYAADVAGINRTTDGGGLAAEEEDIQVVKMSEQAVRQAFISGEFRDAKTLLTLHWYFGQAKRSE